MKTIILENELFFLYYLLKNINKITKIIKIYDSLDNTIYFSSFMDNILIATKEKFNDIDYFLLYQKLFNKYLNIIFINKDNIKLLKKEIN